MPLNALRIDVKTLGLGLGVCGREWDRDAGMADCNNF